MSGADSSTGPLAGNRKLLVAVAVGGLLFMLLLALLGIGGVGGAAGFIGFLVYSLGSLAVVAFMLWLFYRLVVAVERIADAQERRVRAAEHPDEREQ